MTDVLHKLLEVPSDTPIEIAGKKGKSVGLVEIPEIFVDNTDRNRTSPFAFTGNRFEFRAVGSCANCAGAMTTLNAAVAEQLISFKAVAIMDALKPIIKSIIDVVCFDGNGYTEEWKQEAIRRGLDVETNVPKMFCEFTKPAAVEMFTKTGVYTQKELEARNEVKWETYVKKVQIESRVMVRMAINHIIPAAIAYKTALMKELTLANELFGNLDSCRTEVRVLERINKYVEEVGVKAQEMKEARKAANAIEGEYERALAYHEIAESLYALRKPIDKLEEVVDNTLHQLAPMKQGLYDAASEHDACGIGMVVNIRGDKTHELVDNALTVLENMSHRGAEGADGKSGDGAGILVQIPHEFILLQGIPVPEKGRYGTGLMFLPKDEVKRKRILESVRAEVEHDGCILSHIREVPVNSACLGKDAAKGEPYTVQIFVTSAEFIEDADFERKLYRIRKHIERLGEDCYICSLSNRNIVYKGMLTSRQLREYYTDLTSQWFTSAMAIVHSRFSTNTFPQWSLAQPFRMLCHNGEINTIRGNRSWMQARQSVLNSGRLGDIGDITPIVQPEMSDSASLDNVLEFLTMSGLSLPQAVSVLMPESFDGTNPISEDLRAFYEYHSILMEPWDGPATLLFSDGRYAGGIQDRNGLRPGRYTITKRGILVVASEVGVLDFDPTEIECKGRLEPGKMLLVDTKEGKIWYDSEIKEKLASEHPYRKWLSAGRIQLEDLHSGRKIEHNEADLLHKELLFGCTAEDVENTIRPMCEHGIEATSSMGNDTPLAILTERPQPFFDYFRQQFAQVTNPPIDSIREQMVMSLFEYIGRVGTGILTPDEDNCKMVRLPHPILTNTQLDLLCNIPSCRSCSNARKVPPRRRPTCAGPCPTSAARRRNASMTG